MARQLSRREAEIETRLKQLDPSSERHRVLSAARAFRASWVELGEWLTMVRDKNRCEPWGYKSFEEYCTRELGLKRDTALKLTRSFTFLRDEEPQALNGARAHERELPPLDVVDMLSQARERTKASDDDIATITREVLAGEGAQPPTRQQVAKRFRELDPEAFKGRGAAAGGAAAAEKQPGDEDPQELRKALLLAERLQLLLESYPVAVSSEAVDGVRRAVIELRTRFEECRRRCA